MNRTITVTSIEPAPLSFRHPLGVNLDLFVTMKNQNGSALDPTTRYPQFIIMPRSMGGVLAYDMAVQDAINGISKVSVPGASLTDRSGYSLELYLRAANPVPGNPPQPTQLAATGMVSIQGSGYDRIGPMTWVNVPTITGPAGPAGAAGPAGGPGQRGSIWTTGSGAPAPTGTEITGDMYLDEATGDVYRYANGAWTRGTF